MSWKAFIESHFRCIAAIDTFTVEVLTFAGLVRHHVLFVIDIATRRVENAGVTNNACGTWTEQIARASIDSADRARPVRRQSKCKEGGGSMPESM